MSLNRNGPWLDLKVLIIAADFRRRCEQAFVSEDVEFIKDCIMFVLKAVAIENSEINTVRF